MEPISEGRSWQIGHDCDFGSVSKLLVSFSLKALIDQVTAVVTGTQGPAKTEE